MKSKDLALVLIMTFIGVVAALAVSHLIFSSPKNRQQTAEVVDPISSQFTPPPAKYFNSDAVNPAPNIQIGNNNNTNPFNTSTPQ